MFAVTAFLHAAHTAMEIIKSLLIEHSALQAIVVLSMISAAGILLGKIRVGGISLGITFVFFVGIFAGH